MDHYSVPSFATYRHLKVKDQPIAYTSELIVMVHDIPNEGFLFRKLPFPSAESRACNSFLVFKLSKGFA